MSQSFETFVPKLKHEKLLARAESVALANEKNQDQQTLKQATEEATAYFEQYRFWWINDGEMIFDRETGLLWQGKPNLSKDYYYNEQDKAKQDLVSVKLGGLKEWRVPLDTELWHLVKDKKFPLQHIDGNKNAPMLGRWQWLTQDNKVLHMPYSNYSFNKKNDSWSGAYVIAVHSLVNKNMNSSQIFKMFAEKKWKIYPFGLTLAQSFVDTQVAQHLNTQNEINKFNQNRNFYLNSPFAICDSELQKIRNALIAYQDQDLAKFYNNLNLLDKLSKKTYNHIPQVSIAEVWQNLDHLTARLPKIDTLRFSDVDQGMWEFFAPKALQNKYSKITSEQSFRERNPVLDIREANVAIDFGTSSTVVAIRSHGKDELLRIGMQAKDYAKDEISDQHYENPTVLEFLDLQNFLTEWQSEVYRPLVNWDHIHCSHEARAKLRNNASNSQVVSSIFARLKQWALRDEKQAQVRLSDQQRYEYQLKPLSEYNPVKGKAIELSKDYPEIDPIEIYAWFLGMNINWRERGIFLNYYLTFPVEYPNDVKAKILASFRRGLQRSLPESLIYDERFTDFSVEELASEPAAFAAAALERLEIEPVDGGVSYAVFDFGGGTTDFDYGFYRTPDAEEYDEGWDHVIEHFGSSGDKFLGGENLLENLAYLVFQANSSECRKKNIAFTKPLDADAFAGSELLIAQTQAAYTNTTLMMSKLRPLWETGQMNSNSDGLEQFKLIDKNGQLIDCNITIQQKDLLHFLEERIRKGLINFFVTLNVAFSKRSQNMPELVHILLAGNSSRSRIVLGLLGRLDDDKSKTLYERFLTDLSEIFEDISDFEIHLPLDANPKKPYAATAKTGVALGLLRLCPGESLKVINHAEQENADSPFQYFVGSFRRDNFQVALQRGHAYEEWKDLGRPLNGVFVMGYTTSAQAAIENAVKRGESGLFEQNIRLSGKLNGHKVYAKVTAPDEIEICTATDLEALHQQATSNNRKIQLKI